MAFSIFPKKDQPTTAKPKPEIKPQTPAAAPNTQAPSAKVTTPPAKEVKEENHAESVIDFTPNAKHIEVEDFSQGICGVLENAALLYANGQMDLAIATLLDGVRNDSDAQSTALVWLALLDLFQMQNMKKEFDEVALEFVVKFERSPPVWIDKGKQAAVPKPAQSSSSYFVMTNGLDVENKGQIEQLQRLVSKNTTIRIDLGKLQNVDEEGCRLLFVEFAKIKKNKSELMVKGANQLIKLLQEKVQSGVKENEACWLLLLEIYQTQLLENEFEELAIDYAVTFELSPPSWEPSAYRKPAADPTEQTIDPVAEAAADLIAKNTFTFKGILLGAAEPQINELGAFVASHDQIMIQMEQVSRIDFICAGGLLNALTSFKKQGKSFQIIGASHILTALLQVLGFDKIAHLVQQKLR